MPRFHHSFLARLGTLLLAFGAGACARGTAGAPTRVEPSRATVRESEVRRLLGSLAADSMEGRATASRGGDRAARYIAEEFRAIGLEPAGDSGYLQRVPLVRSWGSGGREQLSLVEGDEAAVAAPVGERTRGLNVVGLLRGSDPALREEAILVDAHYDHLGIGAPQTGDSIYNGADDDASGVVAVLEVARVMASGPRPKRTIIFLATTGEEVGLLGTRWYIAHPVVPLAHTVANLEVEMIGRPDSLAGGEGKGWLTGYDRSTMGEMLRAAGIPLVADPRPEQNFFERSDNIAFARRGIPAHTLSSYNMHEDYHTPDDEVERVDFPHMTAVIDAAARAVRLIADGPAPTWIPGRQPTR